jgi:prevent-host-death family protein
MIKVSARTAHHAFSKYLDLAHEGQEIVITKRGKPWATIGSAPAEARPNKPKKLDWNKVFERTHEIFKGRKVDAVKTLLELRDEERW